MKILHYPLTKIIVAFILGIVLSSRLDLDYVYLLITLSISLITLCTLHFFGKKTVAYKTGFGIICLFVGLLLGIFSSQLHDDRLVQNHYSHVIPKEDDVIDATLVIQEKLRETTKNRRYKASIISVNGEASYGKIIVNISKKEAGKTIQIGDKVSVNASYFENKPNFNPHQFNYGEYLEKQQIYGQLYVKSSDIVVIGIERSLWISFSNYRESLIANFEKTSLAKDELYVFVALLLGQQQDISPEILKDYQYAGAVHILSVSGLHIGFILMFLNQLLSRVPNSKNGSLLKLFIILIGLWSFATLAGLSASVVRSVTMFSFLAIGNHLRRTVNIYYTLLVSMFLLLLFKPSFLYDVGFQLSYLALFFIIWLQPILHNIWQPKNKIVTYFWSIITVSTAAQIGTMPLSIYYFHQFPGLFFLTNLVILPLLGMIMAVGVISILLAAINFIPDFIVHLVSFSIKVLNAIIHWVAGFESFVIQNISFSETLVWLSYLVIISFVLYLKNKSFYRLISVLIAVILLQFGYIYQKKITESSHEVVIFNQNKNTLITERIGDKVSLYTPDSLHQKVDENQAVQSYLIGTFSHIRNKENYSKLMYLHSKKIVVIDKDAVYSKKAQPDIVLLVNSPKVNLDRMIQQIKPKQIIADGSNFKSYCTLWKQTCIKQKIPFHHTSEKGSYIW
jgi:competence protein ComEC